MNMLVGQVEAAINMLVTGGDEYGDGELNMVGMDMVVMVINITFTSTI